MKPNELDQNKREHGETGKATAEVVSPTPEDPTRPAPESRASPLKCDELFRQGTELYRQGAFERAIHVWTRILFIERGHARARRAIECAKWAGAERQRELDVEIAAATLLVEKGEIEEASERVQRVLEMAPRHAEAHVVAARIATLRHRNENSTASVMVADEGESLPASKRGLLLRVSRPCARGRYASAPTSPLKMAAFVLGAVLVFAAGALYLHLNWEAIVGDGAFGAETAFAAGAPALVDPAVPGPSELSYYNGARLYGKGRYREALAELSRVGRDSASFERARTLMLRIEQRLLRGAPEPDLAAEIPPPSGSSRER